MVRYGINLIKTHNSFQMSEIHQFVKLETCDKSLSFMLLIRIRSVIALNHAISCHFRLAHTEPI